MGVLNIPVKPKRNFLPQDLEVNSWSIVESYFKELETESIVTFQDFQN